MDTPFVTSETPMKKYRLIKDLPLVNKGAIFYRLGEQGETKQFVYMLGKDLDKQSFYSIPVFLESTLSEWFEEII